MYEVGPSSTKNRFSASTAAADAANTRFVQSTRSYNNLSQPDSSRNDFAMRLARRATTAADGEGAGSSSSLMLVPLQRRAPKHLFSFPFRLFGPFFPSPLSFYPFFYERAHSSPI